MISNTKGISYRVIHYEKDITERTYFYENEYITQEPDNRNIFLGNYTCASDISCKFAKEIEREKDGTILCASIFGILQQKFNSY